ncbi:MAG: SurA N-terminal domain-containing protein [Pseudomonadota bacterium]
MHSKSLRLLWVMLIMISFIITAPPVKAEKEDKAVKAAKTQLVDPNKKIEKVEIKEIPKGDVAVVNGVTIKSEDFARELFGVQQQYANKGEKLDEKSIADIKKKVLEKLIDGELLYQESVKNGFKVDNSTVEEQYTKFKEQFPNEKEFKKEMAKVKLTEPALKNQMNQVMTIQKYINKEFVEKIKVSDEEIKNFFETHLKERIEEKLKQEKIQDEVAKHLDQLKEKGDIKRNI